MFNNDAVKLLFVTFWHSIHTVFLTTCDDKRIEIRKPYETVENAYARVGTHYRWESYYVIYTNDT